MASNDKRDNAAKPSVIDEKREIRRRYKRKIHEHVAEDLNVVPMMDMMTIILVFLLKSVSSSSASVPQNDDLQLPHSTVDTAPSNAMQVIVSRVSITVNGRFIASLRNGFVDPSLKRGGGTGLVINPLSSEMRDRAQEARTSAERVGQRFRGDIAIIADHRTPSRTIFEVLYTCGQSGFSNFQLLVLKSRTT